MAGAKGGDIGSNFVHAIFADRVIPTLFAPFAGGYSHSLRLFGKILVHAKDPRILGS